MRQQTPGTSTAQHVKDPIENLAHVDTSGAASWLGWGNQWFKNGPFGIREITGIRFHGKKSSSLSTSFVSICFYCTTFPHPAYPSSNGSPRLFDGGYRFLHSALYLGMDVSKNITQS